MSTHALIALMLDSDERYVEAVYVHCDGGPDRLGRLLLDHYASLEAVEAILAAGDYHALRESVGLSRRADPPVGARDGELWLLAHRNAAEYVYVYDRGWWWSPTAERRLRRLTASDVIPSHLRADGVDAGSYTVSEPMTVEIVLERVAEVGTLRRQSGGPTPAPADRALLALYRDVLGTIAASDRHGPLGALVRAALTAAADDRGVRWETLMAKWDETEAAFCKAQERRDDLPPGHDGNPNDCDPGWGKE